MKKGDQKSKRIIGGLMAYLRESGEERLLPEVTKSLEHVLAKSKKSDTIVVTSVAPLTAIQLGRLKIIVQNIFRINLPIVNKIDKQLLGGFTVSLDDWHLDASLWRELVNLKRALTA